MTALCGVVGGRPREVREHECLASLQAQSLYWRRRPRIESIKGASFGAALFESTSNDAREDQPVVTGRHLLVADTRIDNRDELVRALGAPLDARDWADSRLILAGWERWGTGIFDRLVGSFSIAIFDEASGRVTLARGPSSDRPLCFSVDDDGLRFASMPSGVLAGRPFAANLTALAHLIVQGDFAPDETCFRAVRNVRPGHWIEWDGCTIRESRFWHPPQVDPTLTWSVVDEFRHILDESVACRMDRVAGPVATHLSGGFDSSAITATAARLDPENLVAFTMVPAPGMPLSVPRNYVADERAPAIETAAMYGIRHELIAARGPLLDELKDHSRVYQVPVPNVPNHGWGIAIQRAAADAGARVLLTGVVGNATISFGAIDLLSEWLEQGRYLDYVCQAHKLVRSGAARWRGALFYSTQRSLPSRVRRALDGSLPVTAEGLFIAPEWLQRVEADEIPVAYSEKGVREAQYQIYAGGGDDGFFLKGTLARFGIDERDPSSDRRLIEFAMRLPAQQFVDRGVTRRLAREGLADRLPASVIGQKIRGYQGADWFPKFVPAEARALIEEISASESAGELLDLRQMERDLDRLPHIASLDPRRLREWGQRFTRALAVGTFIRDVETAARSFGRAIPRGSGPA